MGKRLRLDASRRRALSAGAGASRARRGGRDRGAAGRALRMLGVGAVSRGVAGLCGVARVSPTRLTDVTFSTSQAVLKVKRCSKPPCRLLAAGHLLASPLAHETADTGPYINSRDCRHGGHVRARARAVCGSN